MTGSLITTRAHHAAGTGAAVEAAREIASPIALRPPLGGVSRAPARTKGRQIALPPRRAPSPNGHSGLPPLAPAQPRPAPPAVAGRAPSSRRADAPASFDLFTRLPNYDRGLAPAVREGICALAAERILAAFAPVRDAVLGEIGLFARTLDAQRCRLVEDAALAARLSYRDVLADCTATIAPVALLTLCLSEDPGEGRHEAVALAAVPSPYGVAAPAARPAAFPVPGGCGGVLARGEERAAIDAVLARLHRRALSLSAADPVSREALLDHPDGGATRATLRRIAVAHALAALRATANIRSGDLEALALQLQGSASRAPVDVPPAMVDIAMMLGSEVATATLARRAHLAGVGV